jgi:hypothetical protein
MLEFGGEHHARRRQGDTSYAGRRAGIKRAAEEELADRSRVGRATAWISWADWFASFAETSQDRTPFSNV